MLARSSSAAYGAVPVALRRYGGVRDASNSCQRRTVRRFSSSPSIVELRRSGDGFFERISTS